VQLEVRGLNRKLPAFQVFGGCHDIANALAYAGGNDAPVLQRSEADRDVNIFRNQIEEEIRDEEVDPDPRLSFQEPREEVEEGLLTQNDRNGYSSIAVTTWWVTRAKSAIRTSCSARTSWPWWTATSVWPHLKAQLAEPGDRLPVIRSEVYVLAFARRAR
jgi:hypothetical protein